MDQLWDGVGGAIISRRNQTTGNMIVVTSSSDGRDRDSGDVGDGAAAEGRVLRGGTGTAGTGMWLAADHDNAFPDVWGSLYLVALNLSTPQRRAGAMTCVLWCFCGHSVVLCSYETPAR